MPSTSSANDANTAIACLSLGSDGMLLLHKVMCHLALEDHLVLFQTCTAFRRILATETNPTAACKVFPQAVSTILHHLRLNDHERNLCHVTNMTHLYVRPENNKEIHLLVRIMAIGAPVAAAVVSAGFWWRLDLFCVLCRVWRGVEEHPLSLRPPEFVWDCCNDEVVMAAMNRKRRRGLAGYNYDRKKRPASGSQEIPPYMPCIKHRQWLEHVLSVMFSHQCYDIQETLDLDRLVRLARHCNPSLIAAHLLGMLERIGVVSASPSPLAPAFDPFPKPPPPQTGEPSPDVHLGDSEKGQVGALCLLALWKEAFLQHWDSLLDHLLLRYRLPWLGDCFREACKEGRTALAMRIVEVRGAWLDLYEVHWDNPLSLAMKHNHDETLHFLLWIGRKGIGSDLDSESADVAIPPWLQRVRSKLEESARRLSTHPTTLRVTLSGIRATANHPVAIDPAKSNRAPLRCAASKGTVSTLNLLAHAAGGWQALANIDGTNAPIVHDDLHMANHVRGTHLLRGLEDLLFEACRCGHPSVVRFLVDKIRHALRTGPTDPDRAALFVKTLSVCLEMACHRSSSKEAATVLETCRYLLFETEEDEDGPPSASPHPLVASPSFRESSAFCVAAGHGHEAVVSLLLPHPHLSAAALYRALAMACESNLDHIVSLLLTHPSLDVNLDTRNFYRPSRRTTDDISSILDEPRDDGAIRAGHFLVSAAIVKGHVRTLRMLLQDPRFDAGSALLALKLACKSEKPEMVVEVLAAERYAEVFRTEGGDTSIDSEIVKTLTEFAIEMVVDFWESDASFLPTAHLQSFKEEIMQKERETFDMLKRLLLSGWVDPMPVKNAIVDKTKLGKPWQDAVDFFITGSCVPAGNG
ncbi:hypothetical protein HDU96_000460 [Phlyctochytrium bullatum]|nr:hypothetical protein HDU96_000460 [Phlyctochytrium bullatum]